jgi:hypothetical protein
MGQVWGLTEIQLLPEGQTMTDSHTDSATALMTIVKALTDLNPEDRRRTLDAAMTFFGEKTKAANERKVEAMDAGGDGGDESYPAGVTKWMKIWMLAPSSKPFSSLPRAAHAEKRSHTVTPMTLALYSGRHSTIRRGSIGRSRYSSSFLKSSPQMFERGAL